MQFQKATKKRAKARVALVGPSGSGKTYSSLAIATGLGTRIAVIDTERGSASKYSQTFSFDVLELDSFSPDTYVEAIEVASREDYDVIVIDSLSHAWMGKDGALEQLESEKKRQRSENSFAAWRNITPMHNRLVEAMLRCSAHLIATMRTKTEYVIEENDKGKKVPRKIGLAPVQRDGLEYEFDLVGDMNLDNALVVSKTRCSEFRNAVVELPGRSTGERLLAWLSDGEDAPPKPPTPSEAWFLEIVAGLDLVEDAASLEAQQAKARPRWSSMTKDQRDEMLKVVEAAKKRIAACASQEPTQAAAP